MAVIKSACGIIFDETRTRLLAVMPEWTDMYLLPGGKVKEGESPEQCLVREIETEELSGIKIVRYDYFIRYDKLGKALFDDGELQMDTYLVQIEGVPKRSGEIKEIRWISERNSIDKRVKLANVFGRLIPDLRKRLGFYWKN